MPTSPTQPLVVLNCFFHPSPSAPGALTLLRLAPSFTLRQSPFLNPKLCSAENPPSSHHPTPLPRRPPRIPEPVQLPAVPDGKLSAASSASSLASAG